MTLVDSGARGSSYNTYNTSLIIPIMGETSAKEMVCSCLISFYALSTPFSSKRGPINPPEDQYHLSATVRGLFIPS